MRLAELQERFARAIAGPDEKDAADQALARAIAPGTLAPFEALAVYRNNTHGVLAGALAEIFPTCHALLGADNFDRAARLCARSHPARTRDLTAYGAEFPAYLAALPGLETFRYLEDLARFDFYWNALYYAAGDDDEAGVPAAAELFERMLAADPERRALRLRRPAFLFESRYPVHRIREAVLADPDGVDPADLPVAWPEPAPGAGNEARATRLILYRIEFDFICRELSADQWRLLRAVESLTRIARLDQTGALTPDRVAILLGEMAAAGWLGDLVDCA